MIKLYLDEDVHKKVATALRLKGYDAVSAHEVQKQSLTDHEQLDFAISQGRAIFTFNSGDFNRLHAELMSRGVRRHHSRETTSGRRDGKASRQISFLPSLRRDQEQYLLDLGSSGVREPLGQVLAVLHFDF